MMTIRGKAIRFGNHIDTDQIIGPQHLTLATIAEMAPFTFEHHPQFATHFQPGDIIVAEDNFGCGSSREQAPSVLKARGVAAIVARSFARIFFRNAINLGIPLLECPQAAEIDHLEPLEIEGDALRSLAKGCSYRVNPLPPFVRAFLDSGGIIPHLRQRRT